MCVYIYIYTFENIGGKKTGKSSRCYVINGIYILNLATKTLKNQQFYFLGEGIKKKTILKKTIAFWGDKSAFGGKHVVLRSPF